jgi:hypothetical protein
MNIKIVRIRNFRGIQSLDWEHVPNFVCLIGPANSTKTSILDAIELCLLPRAQYTFYDSDFFRLDIDNKIEVEVTVGNCPAELLTDGTFGLYSQGWFEESGLTDDPVEGAEPVLTVRLDVDGDFEPNWSVVKPSIAAEKRIGWKHRSMLGIGRLGPHVDRHLSWGRYSALTKLTGGKKEVESVIAETWREVRQSILNADFAELKKESESVRVLASDLGASVPERVIPALNPQSISTSGAVLSLADSHSVPLTSFGLATRRLMTLALEKASTKNGAIVMIDEVEHALEPFRVRHLVRTLRRDQECAAIGQVFVSSHSRVVVEEVKCTELHLVRRTGGKVEITRIPDTNGFQRFVRVQPEPLLAKSVILCEGKTEMGIIRGLDLISDEQGNFPLSSYGSTVANGKGSEQVAIAKQLSELGVQVCIFRDSDVSLDQTIVAELVKLGIEVIEWADDVNTEQRLCRDLSASELSVLLNVASSLRGEETIKTDLGGTWEALQAENIEEEHRNALAQVMISGCWFKQIEKAELLASLVHGHMTRTSSTNLSKVLHRLFQWANNVG